MKTMFTSFVTAAEKVRTNLSVKNISMTVLIAFILMFGQKAQASLNNVIPNGVVFRIAGNGVSVNNTELEKDYAPVTKNNNETEFGAYTDYLLAQKAKNNLCKEGLENVEIRAYFHYNRISLDDALTLLNDMNASEGDADQYQSTATMPIDQMNQLMKMVAATEYYYTVTFEDGGKDFSEIKELNGNTTTKKDAAGNEVISFGSFKTYESALAFQQLIAGMGMKNVQVSAWGSDDQPLSLELAANYEATAMEE